MISTYEQQQQKKEALMAPWGFSSKSDVKIKIKVIKKVFFFLN